jgi:TPP-dependent 2-oxoacid decarboxylase
MQTVGEFLFNYLYSKGVMHAFGIPGDFALPTFRWLDKSPIRLITMTHEPSVGFAADGYARMKGLGVACVTYCVGGLNMLNSVACAYAEKSPLLVISGGPATFERRANPLLHHKVRTFDTQRRIYEEVTCANTVLLDGETAAMEIIRVVEEIKAQCRPGYIEIPYDVVDLPCRPPSARFHPVVTSDADNLQTCLEEVTEWINKAQRPVIIADVELQRHGLTDLAVAISEKFNIPIAATLLSKSIISETHPHYIGVYSGGLGEPACQTYVETSDCVILLGAFITDIFLGEYTAKLERKNCILATTEKTCVSLHRYENIVFREFLEGLQKAAIQSKFAVQNPNPASTILPLQDNERAIPLDVETFFRILALTIPECSNIICDAGDALLGAMGLRTAKRNNFLADAYYLSMGFAVPAAIGAMAADPKGRTIAIVGDGAFQMTGIELSTAAKEHMVPVVCLLNNDGYGTQRHIIDGPFNNIHPWHYTKICDLLGYGRAVRVTQRGELEDSLKAAFAGNEMVLIEVVIPRDNCSASLKRMAEQISLQRDVNKRK